MVSPFAPETIPSLPPVAGVTMATGHSGMRYEGRNDVLLMNFSDNTQVAGVFTKSSMPGIPVEWDKSILSKGTAKGLVVNAGISNVFTGTKGQEVVKETVDTAAELLGCTANEIFVSSTGTIGDVPDKEKLTAILPALKNSLDEASWTDAALTITTTDTFPKLVGTTVTVDGKEITINGFAKGSGMVAPDMATMLVYFFTDANIPAKVLQKLVTEMTNCSFNAITVDSDMSTSDTLLMFATGKAGNKAPASENDPMLDGFKDAMKKLFIDLAQQVVKDGEGISKFMTVEVRGAKSDDSAKKIALAIANSPLVKTAVSGEDPNWGRIVMAIGKSAEPANRDKTSITIGNILIAEDGALHPDYEENVAAEYMTGENIHIIVNVGVGDGKATIWSSDLTHEYITINADYRS